MYYGLCVGMGYFPWLFVSVFGDYSKPFGWNNPECYGWLKLKKDIFIYLLSICIYVYSVPSFFLEKETQPLS